MSVLHTPHPSIHLGVDLSETGASPAVWRAHGSRAARPFDQEQAVRLARVAAHGALDFVVFDASFTLHPSRDTTLAGVLDPAVVARRIASLVPGVGVVAQLDPVGIVPEHVAQAIAAVDERSNGRAGWQVAGVAVQDVRAVQRLWDSRPGPTRSEHGPAEQRQTHDGVRFAVRTHRPGARTGRPHPPVFVALPADEGGALDAALALAGQVADVVRVRARELEHAATLRARVREAVRDAGRDPQSVRVLVDLYAVIGPDQESSAARLDLLRRIEDAHVQEGSLVVANSPVHLAMTLQDWVDAGAADGFVVRPAALATDLDAFVAAVVPVLQGAGYLRTAYPGSSLRDTLGLRRARQRVVVPAPVGV